MSLLTTTETIVLYCPACARDTLAEAPPCPDGHGDCCPDRACLECGTALFDAPIIELVRPARRDQHRARPRRAA